MSKEKLLLPENGNARVRQILAQVRALAVEYYDLTGKPLGVTGEIAEYAAADLMNLILEPARTHGFDAVRVYEGKSQRIQIKGRAVANGSKRSQRLGTIKRGAPCDAVMLVLLDKASLEPVEIWEATYASVEERLNRGGSKARERGSLGVGEFKNLAQMVWSVGNSQRFK
jgi:hypothetical protein